MAWHGNVYEQFDSIDFEPIAVRGERLDLVRITLGADGGFASVFLMLGELDDDGRFASMAIYDADDLDAAVAELDERTHAGEGAEHADLVRTNTAWTRAVNDVDLDGLRELAAPDFVLDDRRALGWPTLDIEGFIDIQRAYADVHSRMLVRTCRMRGRATLSTVVNDAVDADGGPITWEFVLISVVDADGRITRAEIFADEDWEAALARLRRAEHRRSPYAACGERARCARERALVPAGLRRRVRGRSGAARPRLPHGGPAPHGVGGAGARGRDSVIDFARATLDVGFVDVAIEPIAVRGECLSLNRMVIRDGDGNEVPFLFLTGHTRDGIGVLRRRVRRGRPRRRARRARRAVPRRRGRRARRGARGRRRLRPAPR